MVRGLMFHRAEGTQSLRARVRQTRFLALLTIVATAHVAARGLGRDSSLLDGAQAGAGVQSGGAQTPTNIPAVQPARRAAQRLLVTVVDENGVAVASAQVSLANTQVLLRGETDYAGRREFVDVNPGLYQVHVEKEGFYAFVLNDFRAGEVASLEITLNHVREFKETVNVIYSPPAIDPQRTADTKKLGSQQIVNLPFTVTRDIRYALPMLPGVLQDAFGQLHIDGSSTRQIQDQLDGFNVTDPISGLFNMRVSIDALESAEVSASRYSTEYGKGSGGVVSLRTGMGDNHFRFSATDFLPSLQNRKGIHVNSWIPRATISGPIRKDKAWFLEALDGDYNLNIVNELPRGSDQNFAWRVSNLAKAQINLTPANILTASFLVNHYRSEHAGLSRFNPVETTVDLANSAYLFTLRDQALFSGGLLVEAGLGISEFFDGFRPLGSQTYIIHPGSVSGNFFERNNGRASRLQGITNLYLPPQRWHGRHEFKVGADLDRLTDHQTFERRPFLIQREDQTLSRRITFSGGSSFARNNFEVSAYAQDRWALSDRWLVEPGLRFDWDQIVRGVLVSPRLASTYLLSRRGDTKVAWGVGLYYDPSNLDFLTRSLTGQRFDFFYDPSGQNLIRPAVVTVFHINDQALKEPRFLNWSIGLDRKMPYAIFLRLQYVQKRGWDGWTFINLGANQPGQFSGEFELKNQRRDRYDALEFALRRMFKGNHEVFVSYTRSAARSNAVLNFNLESLLFTQQVGGPLAWDSPNRLITWAWLPLPRGLGLAYSFDWRDGYPFGLVNQDQQLVAPPGARRFPTYLSLNLHVERRFSLLDFQWAVRVGFDDITNRHNPFVVDNNVDSPNFMTFGGIQGRALTMRIRLLGRK